VIAVGGIAVGLQSEDNSFRRMIEARYCGFLDPGAEPIATFSVELHDHSTVASADAELEVNLKKGVWSFQRGDFQALWNPASGLGRIQQTANPYSTDSVLRIVQSIVLARSGGFLLHAASAVFRGCAYLFAGVSGAGKTTISRLAPSEAILLSDEISFIRRQDNQYQACGTPFAGEFGKPGKNISVPLNTIFFLEQGKENRIEDVAQSGALQMFLRNVLFFSHDEQLVDSIFDSAFRLVERVPMRRLIFAPQPEVWEIIGATERLSA
jgi:hypothetical protein